MAAPVIHRQAALTRRRSSRDGPSGFRLSNMRRSIDRSLHSPTAAKAVDAATQCPIRASKATFRADRWHREQGELALALFFLFNLPADAPTAIGVIGRRRTHIWPRISRRNASAPTACGLRKRWRDAGNSERSQSKRKREKFIDPIKFLHVTLLFQRLPTQFGSRWTAASCLRHQSLFRRRRRVCYGRSSRLRDRLVEVWVVRPSTRCFSRARHSVLGCGAWSHGVFATCGMQARRRCQIDEGLTP